MSVRQELRRSARALSQTPWIAAGVVVAGALGIGAATAVFGFLAHLVDPGQLTGAFIDERVVWRLRTVSGILRGSAAVVFLAAAATVVTLLASRAAKRRHDLSVRVGLGASAWALTRPLLVEGALVGLVAAAAGVLAAFWLAHGLPALFYAEDADALPFVVSRRGIAGAAIAGVLLIVAVTLLPRIGAMRPRAARTRGAGATQRHASATRTLLIAQVALSAMLLLSFPSLVQRIEASLQTPAAARVGHADVWTAAPPGRRANPELMEAFVTQVEAHLGTSLIALLETLPGGDRGMRPFIVDPPSAAWRPATAMTTMFDSLTQLRGGRGRVVAGRLFGGMDRPDTCPVVVVNDVFAERTLSDDAVGRVLVSENGRAVAVIGVWRDGRPEASSAPRVWLHDPQGLRPASADGLDRWRVPVEAGPRATVEMATVAMSVPALDDLGLTLVAGRTPRESGPQALCSPVLVNEEAAAHLGGPAAVGQALVGPDGHRREIIGVVREAPLRTLVPRARPTIFETFSARTPFSYYALIRPGVDRAAVERLRAAMPGVTFTRSASLQVHMAARAHAADRLLTGTVAVFAVLALVLALIGVAATSAESVARRRTEFALRLALGAGRRHVVWPVVRESLTTVAVGVACGAFVVSLLSLIIEPVPGVPATSGVLDWLLAVGVLALVAALGSVWPARQACKVNPAGLLRD